MDPDSIDASGRRPNPTAGSDRMRGVGRVRRRGEPATGTGNSGPCYHGACNWDFPPAIPPGGCVFRFPKEQTAMDTPDIIVDALFRYTRALSVALGCRDPHTRLHSERVCKLALELGTLCGLVDRDLQILWIAAGFHDVGKIGVPDVILLKSTPFDEDEWERMKRHAEMGEEIMRATELDGAESVALAIRHHHEYFDGRGYPDSLKGEAIPLFSRIISIVDSYDAMAETRSYHQARDHAQIMDILRRETGHKHDPGLMRIFLPMIEQSAHRVA